MALPPIYKGKTVPSLAAPPISFMPSNGFLGQSPLFHALAPERLRVFQDAACEKLCKKGQMLYMQDDRAKSFYVIRSGWVKLFRETLDGTEAITDIFTIHHAFGETSVFLDNYYSESAQAVEEAVLFEIPTELLRKEINGNPAFAMSMLSVMSRYRRRQAMEIEHLTVQNTPQRIGCFLLRLCTQQKSHKSVTLHLPYDKILLAARLGMQPETFSRALAKLRDEMNMTIQGATITIPDINWLKAYCCSFCSSTYPCEG